jgi:thiol-disulfide isomerase/thioredoxin
MKEPSDNTAKNPSRRRGLVVAAAVAALLAGLAGVYGIGGLQRNAGADAGCQAAVDIAKRIAPLARGEVAALTVAEKPFRVPELSFQGGDGREYQLKDWRGRFVLLNLWATWCVPCRKEMPALDALETRLGGQDFQVVAVNIDTRDPDKPKAWLKEVGINRLAYFADPQAKVFQDLKAAGRAFGMPTTLLIDPQGCEIANLAGPAEWASDDAVKMVEAAKAAKMPGG